MLLIVCVQGSLWGSVHLLRDKVDHYSLQLKPDSKEPKYDGDLGEVLMFKC